MDNPYSSPAVTADQYDSAAAVFTMQYGRSIRSKFKAGLGILSVFFAWGMFFIFEVDWIALGVIVMAMLILYYRLRIMRVVTLTEENLTEKTPLHHWEWKWADIRKTERLVMRRTSGMIPKERIILVHESGREIIIDSDMEGYRGAWKWIWRIARTGKIPVNDREVSFIFLYYF